MAIRLLSVGGEKIRPPGPHVAGHVFHQQGDGVRLAIQGHVQLGVSGLRHGAFGQLFVLAEERERVFQVGGCEFESHAFMLA